MELPQVGQQCAQPHCKQLDFLPVVCKNCHKVFCSAHFNAHSLSCYVKDNRKGESELSRISTVFTCSQEDCNETSIVPLICEKCGKHYCVRHRHIGECTPTNPEVIEEFKRKSAAPVVRFNLAKQIVDKEIEENLNAVKKRDNKRDLINKIQLMKVKNKATGRKTIPSDERVYFNVYFPKQLGEDKCQAVFVSKNWSVGRAIDAIADECKIQNDNNKLNKKKLRLFKKEDRTVISKDVSELLSAILQREGVVDGESLVIEYVDDGCEHI